MEGSVKRARRCCWDGGGSGGGLPLVAMRLLLGLFLALTGGAATPTSRSPAAPASTPSLPSFSGAQCLEGACFALFWAARAFPEASLECESGGGHLMSVRSTVSAEAIALLFQRGGRGRAWLGLKLPEGRCREPGKRLRGFEWVSGEEGTDFEAWGGSEGVGPCGGPALCVSVSPPGLLWEERECHLPAEGFLCEYSYPGGTSCGPLVSNPGLEVEYVTPFGALERDLSASPPGSRARVPSLGLTLECREQKWASPEKGAWDCRVENGGCEGECHRDPELGQPYCSCPEGSALLEEDRRGCGVVVVDSPPSPSSPSPCALLGCQHHCVVPESASASASCMCWEGFALAEDGRRCLDVDDCRAEPSPCEQECLNTPGGFRCLCFPGFVLSEGRCQEADPNWGCFDLGCQQDCAVLGGRPRCRCFEGFAPDPEKPERCLMVCNRSRCSPQCDPHTGNECHCPHGFILDVDDDDGESNVCEDIDECDSGYCGEVECVNTPGSYSCVCPDGRSVQDGALCEDLEGSGDADLDPRSPVATLVPPKEGSRRGMLVGTIVSAALMGVVVLAVLGYLVKKRRSAHSGKDGACQQSESGVVLQHVTSNSASPRLKM